MSTQTKAQQETEKAMAKSTSKKVENFIGMDSKQINKVMQSYGAQISQLLPAHISPQKFISMAVNHLARNEKLKECTARSILGAILQASHLGLDLTPELGQAYLVPYKDTKKGEVNAEFQIGYRGLVSLMIDTGMISHVEAHVVHENDNFDIELGVDPKLTHKPEFNGDRGDIVLVYGVITYTNGNKRFDWMNKKDVYSLRARSKSYKSDFSPWKTDEAEMWRKSILKRMSKMEKMPMDKIMGLASDERIIPIDAFQGKTAGEIDLSATTAQYRELTPAEIQQEVEKQEKEKPKDEPKKQQKPEEEESPLPDEQHSENDLFGGDDGGLSDKKSQLEVYANSKGMDIDVEAKKRFKKSLKFLNQNEFQQLEQAILPVLRNMK